jgi:sigma-B regulation protein RsbU (phosphoserine phosphatase)
MRVLIAEDDPVSRRVLVLTLEKWGYEPVPTSSGTEAWEALSSAGAPRLAILDWMMPGLDGVEVCRRLRRAERATATYVILLTARDNREDLIAGLEAGADDYVTKPFDRDELRARVQVGVRVLELQDALARRVDQLEDALSQVRQLRGLLPICAYCKKIRNDKDYWEQMETYVAKHSEAQFSHGICPTCLAEHLESGE